MSFPKLRKGPSRSSLASLLLLLAFSWTACVKRGVLEERPPRETTAGWRPLYAEEREAVRRRLADERVPVRDLDLDAIRVPAKETPYLEWRKPWTFRGAEVHIEFRLVRFRQGANGVVLPASFTITRLPSVDSERLRWDAGTSVPGALGVVRYHWDIYIPDVIDTRHCRFYEKHFDVHERRHMFYAERLIRKLQEDGKDFASRLLDPARNPATPPDPGNAPSAGERRAIINEEAKRFVEDLPALRDRYWSFKDEEAQAVRETLVSDSDREDLQENCLVHSDAP